MKKNIIIILLLLGSTAVFCQIGAMGIEYRIDRQDIPYRKAPVSSSARDGEIWRPLKAYYYVQSEKPVIEYNCQYDIKGVLQQEKRNYINLNPSLISTIIIYNQTFTKEGFDFPDTLTRYYIQQEADYRPNYRIYYDYHYYDRYPQDSFYYVQYWENWNNITQEWEMQSKFYQGYFDTTLFVIREHVYSNYKDGEWIKYNGTRVLREYNEEGLVTANIIQEVNPQTGEYEMWRKLEYLYDADNIHIETHAYAPDADDWILFAKEIDIEYTEWYPNGQPGIVIAVANGPEYLSLADKRVKMKSYTLWSLFDNDEWTQYATYQHDWDLNGTKSHIETIDIYGEIYGDIYRYWIDGEFYDEREDFIQKLAEGILPDGTFWSSKDCFITSYHPEYDVCESYYRYELLCRDTTQGYDSTFMWLYEYFDWWNVTIPVSITESEPSGSAALTIFPNPVSGIVIISAESEIEQLNIFDITGRLVASPLPAGERVVFDAGTLPQGVYLVRALLKDGGVRRGKVVAR